MTTKKRAANRSTVKKVTISNGQEKRKEARRKDDDTLIKLQEIVLGMHKKIVEIEARLDANNIVLTRAKQRLGL